MDIIEVLEQVRKLLQQHGRLSYRILKRQFELDDEALADLKFELIDVQELAVDKDSTMLVWAGDTTKEELENRRTGEAEKPPPSPTPNPQPPVSYTPPHLAERLLAEQAAMESRGSADGERKTITARFANIKGSTALIEGLDPKDACAIIDPALHVMKQALRCGLAGIGCLAPAGLRAGQRNIGRLTSSVWPLGQQREGQYPRCYGLG